MKRQMFFATAFAAALAVGAAAQTGTGTATSPQTGQDKQPVTITGCLQQASAATGTTGTTGTASSEPKFILTDAVKGSSSASGAAAGTGTAGTSSASMDNKFKLIGGDEDDLKKYVNTKVEIRGTLEKSSMPSSGAATGTGTGAAGSRPQSGDQNLPGLRVTSVRQVAQSCSGN